MLYDKAHKEGLKCDLSRLEFRVISKDIKGGLCDYEAIFELLKSIYKVLDRYEVYIGSEVLNLAEYEIENRCILNSYKYS